MRAIEVFERMEKVAHDFLLMNRSNYWESAPTNGLRFEAAVEENAWGENGKQDPRCAVPRDVVNPKWGRLIQADPPPVIV